MSGKIMNIPDSIQSTSGIEKYKKNRMNTKRPLFRKMNPFLSANIMNDLCLDLRSRNISFARKKGHEEDIFRCLVIKFFFDI